MSQFVSVHLPVLFLGPKKSHNLSPYTCPFPGDRNNDTICLRTRALFLETEKRTRVLFLETEQNVTICLRTRALFLETERMSQFVSAHVLFLETEKMSQFVSVHVPFSWRPRKCHNLSPYTCPFLGTEQNVTICLCTRALFLETERMSQFVSVHVPFSLRPKKCHNLSPYTCPFPGDRTYCRDLSPYTCPFPGDRKNVTICLRTRVLFLETDGATRQSFKEEFGLKKR